MTHDTGHDTGALHTSRPHEHIWGQPAQAAAAAAGKLSWTAPELLLGDEYTGMLAVLPSKLETKKGKRFILRADEAMTRAIIPNVCCGIATSILIWMITSRAITARAQHFSAI